MIPVMVRYSRPGCALFFAEAARTQFFCRILRGLGSVRLAETLEGLCYLRASLRKVLQGVLVALGDTVKIPIEAMEKGA
jgi:hypothetical protein